MGSITHFDINALENVERGIEFCRKYRMLSDKDLKDDVNYKYKGKLPIFSSLQIGTKEFG